MAENSKIETEEKLRDAAMDFLGGMEAPTADRNDELLLALGWKLSEGKESVWGEKPYTPGEYEIIGEKARNLWAKPGETVFTDKLRPRPYDSVDDGIAICKERGWGWGLATVRHPDNSVTYRGYVHAGDTYNCGSDNEAEALAEAISKAVNQ